MIGAMAPGAAGALALEIGVAAWLFFGFFSLGLCTHWVGMGQLGIFVVEDQLAGAAPAPVDSGAAKIFQLCGMQAEPPATGAQAATACSHKRFPAHRVDCGEIEIFPALRNDGERAGDRTTAGNSLLHKEFPAHWAGNDGLADFFGFAEKRLTAWRYEGGDWADPLGECAGTANDAPPGAGRGPGGQKKSRAKGPAQVDQVGMSGCSVLAPTTHCGQTSQTGTKEENGAGLGDGSCTTLLPIYY